MYRLPEDVRRPFRDYRYLQFAFPLALIGNPYPDKHSGYYHKYDNRQNSLHIPFSFNYLALTPAVKVYPP
jgi:hypothetical protein